MDMSKVWQADLVFVPPKVLVSMEVLNFCYKVQSRVAPNEFSVLAKIRPAQDGLVVVGPVYVPRQKVSPTSVDYLENLAPRKEEGYLVVLHSHPFAVRTSFSSADEEFINRNFPLSLLLNKHGDVVDARMTLALSKRVRVVLKDVEVIEDSTELDEVEVMDRIMIA